MSYQEIQSYFDERGNSYDVTAGWIIVHPCREQLIQIGRLIDSKDVRPKINRVFLLSEADQTYTRPTGSHRHGKIVLLVV